MNKSQEMKVKHERLVEYLAANKLDAVVLNQRCNFSWYTCGGHNHVGLATENGAAWLIVTRDGARVVTNNIEATRHRGEEFPAGEIEVIDFPYYDPDAAGATLAKATAGLKKIAADAPLPGVKAAPLGDDFARLRWALTPPEMDRYRALAADAVATLEQIARAAKPGQSENELAGLVGAELYRRDCNFWAVFVGADDRIRKYRHPLPTPRKVKGYFMLIACAERAGLIVSCTRLASFQPLGDELAARHRAVATVDAAMIATTTPGVKMSDVYAEAQAAYAETGFDGEWRLHHQGGPAGYLARDLIANPTTDAAAEDGQAFAWNPSITGTKSEDTILCHASGPEIMGMSPDWPTIDAEWKGATFKRSDILVR
jgi:Xaa-Pro aminopeptidase